MIGIFKYQVPSRHVHTNYHQNQKPNTYPNANIHHNGSIGSGLENLGSIISMVQSLLQSIFGGGHGGPSITTLAVGEEDAGVAVPPIGIAPNQPHVSTRAVGEDGSGVAVPPIAVNPNIPTTLAVGEEDGGSTPPPGVQIEPMPNPPVGKKSGSV